MKLIDWYNFNFNNKQIKTNIGDICVKVFRKESYHTDDKIFECLLKPTDMVNLFGDYELFCIGKHTNNDYFTISVFIYKPEDGMQTSAGIIRAQCYNDGLAKGIKILLDDNVVAMLDIYEAEDGETEGEARVLVYQQKSDFDEPTHCISINR